MGQPARQFPPPQAIGAVNRPNDILSQSMAAPTLPQNALQPLIQNQIPFMATANAVPNAPTNFNGAYNGQYLYNGSPYTGKFDSSGNGPDPYPTRF